MGSNSLERIGFAGALFAFITYCALQRGAIGVGTFALCNVATSLVLGWYNLKKSAWASLALNAAYLFASIYGALTQ